MLLATVLALASAGLHASWNLIIKTSTDRELASWGQYLAGGLLFAPVLLFTGLPQADAWIFIVVSAVVHVAYVEALVGAYHHGDFSLVYPLARGGGALAAALLGVVFLDDRLRAGAWAALVIVAIGLASLIRPGAPRAELGYALATAGVIATYTAIDAAGARQTDNGFAYGVTLTMATAVTLSITGLLRGRGRDLMHSVPVAWRLYAISGVCLAGAYSIVLVAVRLAPVGYVATLRESSVVLGAVLGWMVLGERLGPRRTVSSVIVLAGLVALIVFR